MLNVFRNKNLDNVINDLAEAWDNEARASEIIDKLDRFDKNQVALRLEWLLLEMHSTKIDDILVRAFLKYGGKKASVKLSELTKNPKIHPDLLNTIYLHLDKRNKNKVKRMTSDFTRWERWWEKWKDPNRPGFTKPDAPESPITEPDMTLLHLCVSGDKSVIPILERWEKTYPWCRLGITYAIEGINALKELYKTKPKLKDDILYLLNWSDDLMFGFRDIFTSVLKNPEKYPDNDIRSALIRTEDIHKRLEGKEREDLGELVIQAARQQWNKFVQRQPEYYKLSSDNYSQEWKIHKLYLVILIRMRDKYTEPYLEKIISYLKENNAEYEVKYWRKFLADLRK